MIRCVALSLVAFSFAPIAIAQNDTPDTPLPVITWHFQDGSEPGMKTHVKQFEPGPKPPAYPGFKAENTALALNGNNSGILLKETDLPNVNLRFGLKDTITIESWVKATDIKEGSYVYLVGKGRNKNAKYPDKNQNYALRLFRTKGETKITFLFGSVAEKDKPSDFHRWTSTKGFNSSGWHHVAVEYTFGDGKSIKGVIDGEVVEGTWDMGGATDRAPITDADDVALGTGNGGGTSNTFHGWLDDVIIWRNAVSIDTLKNRYQYIAPPTKAVTFKREDLIPGKVRVDICEEGTPTTNTWPEEPAKATETYYEDAFGFFEVPHKYTDTGVRTDRPNPFILRASAIVNIPAGKHRLLLRGRNAGKLYINDKLILSTAFNPQGGDGHNPVRKLDSFLNLGPDFRFAPAGNQEAWTTYESKGGEQLVILERIVGSFQGKSLRRPEPGEAVVAISLEGSDKWKLLTPSTREYPYNDAGWEAYELERRIELEAYNAKSREAKRKEHQVYWDKRRTAVEAYLKSSKDIPVPINPKGYPSFNSIDNFLNAKIAEAVKQASDAKKEKVDYFTQIQPLLESKCYDCHTGNKAKGDLSLNDRKSSLESLSPGMPGKSSILARVKSKNNSEVMPPKGERLTAEQIATLETWIKDGARWPEIRADHTTLTPLTDDLVFLRRVTLDTVGVMPSLDEIEAFINDRSKDKRSKVIDKLLADPRCADHWMGYWLDVLAENPNILNPTLNNTGPFRWWIHESLLDNKPMDVFATELLRMKGSARFGGPAGFAVASQNDVPMAAKGTIVSTAFLGIEMKCARCHDSPTHQSTQRELFELAGMLGGKSIKVPSTSSVPIDALHQGGRKPLIQVTLKPNTDVQPVWPFEKFVPAVVGKKLAEYPDDSRDVLAALITAPENERFAQVMANRIWKRLMGRGIVEPVDDWERGKASHPELMQWLAREFVRNGYDSKKLQRLILNSHAYQRAVDRNLRDTPVLFTAPAARQLQAEQVVDSLFHATGKPFRTEEVSLDLDGTRDLNSSISLGKPRRSWMLTSTSNERDRPSLALPRVQAVVDVLAAFGWRPTRQDPTSVREAGANVLQPAILQNGTVGVWLTRLSDDHGITKLTMDSKSSEDLVEKMYLRLLTRKPTDAEKKKYVEYLSDGFANRKTERISKPVVRKPELYVTWSNHLMPEATQLRQEQELRARAGDPPTDRLDAKWRERLEDVLWILVTSSEMVFTP